MKQFPDNAEIEKVAHEIRGVLFTRLIVFSDVINRYIDIELKHKTNWVWIYALIVLTTRGHGTMMLSDLAKYMLRSNHAITKLADSLEKAGLVKRHRVNKDRRIRNIKITAAGLTYIKQTLAAITSIEREIRSELEGEESTELAQMMMKIWRLLGDKVMQH